MPKVLAVRPSSVDRGGPRVPVKQRSGTKTAVEAAIAPSLTSATCQTNASAKLVGKRTRSPNGEATLPSARPLFDRGESRVPVKAKDSGAKTASEGIAITPSFSVSVRVSKRPPREHGR